MRRLQEAYTEGHISHEEMDERLHQVLTAKTHSELVSALASLPEEDAGTTPRLPPSADGSGGAAHGGYLGSSRSSPRSEGCAWTCPGRSSSIR
ncbi:MAG TPA: DUF1707 domain-containing protein [Streptosporangiaceae bacterium]|nr:DUF1707 domain-containing protein [Streptosporangiaceae bacterium]